MKTISWNDFEKIDLRTGTIIEVKDFPEALKPAYKLRIDFGVEIGIKNSSAQITDIYSKEDLLGKQIIGVVNFPPKQIGHYISECLVTGFTQDNNSVIIATTDQKVENGLRLA